MNVHTKVRVRGPGTIANETFRCGNMLQICEDTRIDPETKSLVKITVTFKNFIPDGSR